MATIDPVVAPQFYPEMSRAFATWLGGALQGKPDGGYAMPPVAPFDPRSAQAQEGAGVQVGKNDRQAGAWGSWQPWDGGTSFLADYVTNKAGFNPDLWAMMQNYNQYGVQGGYPGELMHKMAQYGGGGNSGAPAMQNALSYGKPSDAASSYVAGLADFGVASEASGRPIANRAYGQQTAAAGYLQPFLSRGNYQPTQIQRRGVTRI